MTIDARSSGFISRSHRAIAPFVLSRPTSIDEVIERLAAGAHVHAGGIDLVERMQRGLDVAEVVDLGRVGALDAIEVTGDRLRIGAAVTHARLEADPIVAETRPDLGAAWRTVGNVRIRRTGTIGGNLMAFDKNYDAAPILAAADAQVVFVDSQGVSSTHPIAGRPKSGLLVAIEVPLQGRIVFDRSLKPVASVAVGTGTVAIGCAHAGVVALARLAGSAADAAASIAAAMPAPLHDGDASSGYRRRVIEVLVRRGLEATS